MVNGFWWWLSLACALLARRNDASSVATHKTLLLVATLDGTLIAVDKGTGLVQWSIQDEPVIQIPSDVGGSRRLVLPDPKDGGLYVVHGGGGGGLKKLPFTIPELVSASPCRSSDGFLYTGRKVDTWFIVDPVSGLKTEVLSTHDNDRVCPDLHNNPYLVYVGKSVFSVAMHDARTGQKMWNVTYSCTIPHGITSPDYELAHLSAASSGLVATIDRATGSLLWLRDYKSPVIAMNVLDGDGLHSVPFSSIATETLTYLTSHLTVGKDKHLFIEDMDLFPRLFVGKWKFGFYALPSLVDGRTLDTMYRPKLLSGPGNSVTVDEATSDLQHRDQFPFVSIGYYDIPDFLPASHMLRPLYRAIEHKSDERLVAAAAAPSDVQDDVHVLLVVVPGLVAVALAAAAALVVFVVVRHRLRTDSKPPASPVVVVGKISFLPGDILGRGCGGTVVFRGKFDNRDVAVKRILPESFSLGQREVELLREADSHANVVRYFCAERDSQFLYIALELCIATLSDYVEGSDFDRSPLEPVSLLRQTTLGLEHLHSLDIVHRDLKPPNVLLTLPGLRVKISDFGLCRKLNRGRSDFTRGAGTDGWIAPEVLSDAGKKTLSVDIFSLGCVFYYVATDGGHPFGDHLQRQSNIVEGRSDLTDLRNSVSSDLAVFARLVQAMISSEPASRPPCDAILKHPAFWSNDRKLQFFADVSDRVEKDVDSAVLRQLERGNIYVVRGDWREHIGAELREDLRKFRSYRGRSVRDLLRALRNKKHHYRELSEEVRSALGGDDPGNFVSYFTSRFPTLLPHTYHAMQVCKDDAVFRQYYSASYDFAFDAYLDVPWRRNDDDRLTN